MVKHVAALMMLLAFGLAPLAQAVDCLMHQPVAHEGHAAHDDHGRMPVADCFSAMQTATIPATTATPDIPVQPAMPVEVPLPAPAPPGKTLVQKPLLHPPPGDVLLLTARRRI